MKAQKMVFITNIIETKDVRLPGFFKSRLGSLLGTFLPLVVWDIIFRIIPTRWGYVVVSKDIDLSGEATADIILCLRPSHQMDVRKKRIQRMLLCAVRRAQSNGATLLDFGSLTKGILRTPAWKSAGILIPVTHGDNLTVAIALEGIRRIKDQLSPANETVAIVGCYGTIGSALALALAKNSSHPLVLIGRKIRPAQTLVAELSNLRSNNVPIFGSTDLNLCKSAGIVVTATSAQGAILRSEHLGRNAIIYDLAQPNNVSPDLLQERPDVLRLDGGIVSVPYNLGFWMRLPRPYTYACTAEGIVQILCKDDESHAGSVSLEYSANVVNTADSLDIHHSPLMCYNSENAVIQWKSRRKKETLHESS